MNKKLIYSLSVLLVLGLLSIIFLSRFAQKQEASLPNDGNVDVSKTIKQLEHYTKVDPDNISYQLELGGKYEVTNQADKAVIIYEKILEKHPDNYVALYRLGNIKLNKGMFDQAFEYYEKCSKSQPENAAPLYMISQISLLRDYDKSVKYAKMAYNAQIKSKGDNPEFLKRYLTCLEAIGNSKQSKVKCDFYIQILSENIIDSSLKFELANKILNDLSDIPAEEKNILSTIIKECNISK